MKSGDELYHDAQEMIHNQQEEAAIEILENILVDDPALAYVHFDLGGLFQKARNKDKALYHFKKSVELEERNIDYLKTLADYYYVAFEDVEAALATYGKALAIDPNDVDTLTISGNLSIFIHRWENAESYYKRVLDLEPWRFEIQEYLDKLALRTGDTDINQESDLVELYQCSQERVRAGDLQGAMKHLEHMIDIDPSFALAYNDMGVIHFQLGEKEKALECYQRAVKQTPGNHVFLKNIADFYFYEQCNLQDALPVYLKILSEEPTDIEVLMTLGMINVHLDRREDAKVFFSRVIEIEPWNLEASEQLEKLDFGMTGEDDHLMQSIR